MSKGTRNNIIAFLFPLLFFGLLQGAYIFVSIFLVSLSDIHFVLSREIWGYYEEMVLPNFQWFKFILGYIFMFFIIRTILNLENMYITCIMLIVMFLLCLNAFLPMFTGTENNEFVSNFSYILAMLSIMYSAIINISRHIKSFINRTFSGIIVLIIGSIYSVAYLNDGTLFNEVHISPIHSNILTIIATILLIYEILLNNTGTRQTILFTRRKCVYKCITNKTLHKIYYETIQGKESVELYSVCKKCGKVNKKK